MSFSQILIICVAAASWSCADPEPAPPPPVVLVPQAPPPPETHEIVHTIQSGDTLGEIVTAYGLSAHEILAAAKPEYDLAQLRAGKAFTFVARNDAISPHEFRYPIDEDTTLVMAKTETGWAAKVDRITHEIIEEVREFSVQSTFWGAAIEAGLRARDIANLAQVYQYDVDFNTEIQAGATVTMVVEALYDGPTFARLGRPLAARFTNKNKEYVAIFHRNKDGDTQYYDEKGLARKKAFLRSPLTFSRVTSGFNPRRYHPVLKRRRPHNGVDFGAPTGTPVRATGEGKVVVAGRQGGHGKYVKIDHPGPYASSYSHLSRINVRNGQKVKQGQVIGLVGSTGMSTGAHLHYQFWQNGRFVNPMKIKLPRNKKIPNAEKAAFQKNREQWLSVLDLSAPTVAMTER